MQLRGFGMTMDIERGTMRSWVVGADGVKRWADSNAPVEAERLVCPRCHVDRFKAPCPDNSANCPMRGEPHNAK